VVGWWFGFGYFLAGMFWIGEAFLVQADKFAVLMPFAVMSLPAGLAIFWAGATAAAVSLGWQRRQARIFVLALTIAGAEWLRGHVLTGLPWNVLGYALTWPSPLMQTAALFGIYGLTIIAVPVFGAPAILWVEAAEADHGSVRRGTGVLLAGVSIAALAVIGSLRLWTPDPPSDGIRVRLVQPSVPQREKWRPENQERIFNDHLELSRRSSSGQVDDAAGVSLIVWPEAAMPFLPLSAPGALAAIGRMLPDGAHLASGALRVEDATAPGAKHRFYNSLMVFGRGGHLVGLYDKIHLVPFGEYLPLQATLEAMGFEQLTRIRGGFDTGTVPRPLLQIADVPIIGPLICYEAIFPGAVVQGSERPAFLLNVTNDGWFGQTTGPYQHLHQTRVRAVEEGLPVLRVANNGISAVIDARGRLLHRLGLDVKGVIDSRLPPAIAPPPYARYGDGIFAAMLAVCGLALAAFRGRLRNMTE
jgi:apolipoprotein N-acyltransferase